jgi:hypothetical protein
MAPAIGCQDNVRRTVQATGRQENLLNRLLERLRRELHPVSVEHWFQPSRLGPCLSGGFYRPTFLHHSLFDNYIYYAKKFDPGQDLFENGKYEHGGMQAALPLASPHVA